MSHPTPTAPPPMPTMPVTHRGQVPWVDGQGIDRPDRQHVRELYDLQSMQSRQGQGPGSRCVRPRGTLGRVPGQWTAELTRAFAFQHNTTQIIPRIKKTSNFKMHPRNVNHREIVYKFRHGPGHEKRERFRVWGEYTD